jgi:hypothetical protein
MVRGTLANIRLRNLLAPGTEGGWTTHVPSGEKMFIYDASVKYQKEGTPLLIIAGKEYGSGSSRDWAAKGTLLLGVRAVIAESFERIHRSNLVGMGVLPMQFLPGENRESLGLTGFESIPSTGIPQAVASGAKRACGRSPMRARKPSSRGAHRYAAGSRILSQRRDPAVCGCGSSRRYRTQAYRFILNWGLVQHAHELGEDAVFFLVGIQIPGRILGIERFQANARVPPGSCIKLFPSFSLS